MKIALITMTLALGVAACGRQDAPPANDPASFDMKASSSETTSSPAMPSAAATPPTRANPRPSTVAPATVTVMPDTNPAAAPAPAPAEATVANNPGVADQTKDATNTKINDRDRRGALTPMDQGGSAAERNITASIRKAVVADKSLSFTAKNVKIITTGSKVTLRGPVKSEEERTAIEARAKQTAGVTEVDNQLEIKK